MIVQKEERCFSILAVSLKKSYYYKIINIKDTRVALLSWKSLQKLAGNLPLGKLQWMQILI